MIYYNQDQFIIRSMVFSDIDKLVEGFSKQNWNKPYELFQEYLHQQEEQKRTVIIAEVRGDIAGYVTLLPYAYDGPFENKNIPEIADFNVLIKYQRQGIGNKMMDVVETLAREISDYVSLSVGLHFGHGSAQRMYVKRHYIPDGSGVWYKGKQLEQYAMCENDDDLILYFLKSLKEYVFCQE